MRNAPVPEVRYARSGDVSIAYQLTGDAARDLVYIPTFSNLVYPWWNAHFRSFYERLGAFARLILLDKRGTGLSDRPRDLGTLETRIDDIRAVLDAAGSEKVSLFGYGRGRADLRVFRRDVPRADAGADPLRNACPRGARGRLRVRTDNGAVALQPAGGT